MKKVEVLAIVKEEIRTVSKVFEAHCKDELTKRELVTYRNYAIGKLTASINIWVSLEMSYVTESGKEKEEALKRAEEIRRIEKELQDNIRAMFEKKLDEIE